MSADPKKPVTHQTCSSPFSRDVDPCEASANGAATTEFSQWLDVRLAELEDKFRQFWTAHSLVGAWGR